MQITKVCSAKEDISYRVVPKVMQHGEQICMVTLCLLWVVMVTSKRNAGYQPKKINYYYYTSCVTSLFSL